MSAGMFGWSYPPGCSGPPEDPDPIEEAQTLLKHFERAPPRDEFEQSVQWVIKTLLERIDEM